MYRIMIFEVIDRIGITPHSFLRLFFTGLFMSVNILSFLGCSSSFLLYPDRQTYASPAKSGFKVQESMLASTDGTKIHTLYMQHPDHSTNPIKHIVLQFHGNGQNLSSHFFSSVWLLQMGLPVYIFDYRGYGKSEGEKSISGTIEDCQMMFRFALEKAKQNDAKLILYGQSLGTSLIQVILQNISIEDQKYISLIIFDGGFLSYRQVAKDAISIVLYPLALLLLSDAPHPEKFKNPANIPVLIIHGEQDDVIHARHAHELHKHYQGSKLMMFPDTGHVDWMVKPVYRRELQLLLGEILLKNTM